MLVTDDKVFRDKFLIKQFNTLSTLRVYAEQYFYNDDFFYTFNLFAHLLTNFLC